MKNFLFCILTILVTNVLSAQLQEDIFTVVAASGLSLRSEADRSSERLTIIPFNAQVIRTYHVMEEEVPITETIGGIKGQWWYVKYDNQDGYVFSPYLKYGYLFRPEKEEESDFKLLTIGERIDMLNYDSSFYWYALHRPNTNGDGQNKPFTLTAVQPTLKFGPEVSQYVEIDGYMGSDIALVTSGLTNCEDILLIGSRSKIDVPNTTEMQSYFNIDSRHSSWGNILYPYQTLAFFNPSKDEPAYYLYATEEIVEMDGVAYKDYEVGISRSYYFDGYSPYGNQNLGPELLLDQEMDSSVNPVVSFKHHPHLLWQGDLNGDGAPELLFHKGNTSECCGGSEYYILLESKVTADGFQWKHAAYDELTPWGGC